MLRDVCRPDLWSSDRGLRRTANETSFAICINVKQPIVFQNENLGVILKRFVIDVRMAATSHVDSAGSGGSGIGGGRR